MATNWSDGGLLPADVAQRVIESAQQQSVILRLAKVTRMPTATETIPVVSVAPQASWVGVGGRKPFRQIEWSSEVLRAEEVAATCAVADALIEDASAGGLGWSVEESVEDELAKAIANRVDNSVLWGIEAPASFPAGGIAASVGGPVGYPEPLQALSEAMGELEDEGLVADGIVGSSAIGRALRTAYLNANALPGTAPTNEIFGVRALTSAPWPSAAPDAFVGAWEYVAVAIRADVSFATSHDATLFDDDGNVMVNCFQDNCTAVKAWARFGVAIAKPLGADGVTPATPIIGASWNNGTETPTPEPEPEPTSASTRKRSS